MILEWKRARISLPIDESNSGMDTFLFVISLLMRLKMKSTAEVSS